jgi:hypothetical protein
MWRAGGSGQWDIDVLVYVHEYAICIIEPDKWKWSALDQCLKMLMYGKMCNMHLERGMAGG